MAALKAARDFGLDPAAAARIARRAPREHLAEALARALIQTGADRFPATPAGCSGCG